MKKWTRAIKNGNKMESSKIKDALGALKNPFQFQTHFRDSQVASIIFADSFSRLSGPRVSGTQARPPSWRPTCRFEVWGLGHAQQIVLFPLLNLLATIPSPKNQWVYNKTPGLLFSCSVHFGKAEEDPWSFLPPGIWGGVRSGNCYFGDPRINLMSPFYFGLYISISIFPNSRST